MNSSSSLFQCSSEASGVVYTAELSCIQRGRGYTGQLSLFSIWTRSQQAVAVPEPQNHSDNILPQETPPQFCRPIRCQLQPYRAAPMTMYPAALFCDLHGHSRKTDAFMYGCATEHAREKLLPSILSEISPYFSFNKCSFKALYLTLTLNVLLLFCFRSNEGECWTVGATVETRHRPSCGRNTIGAGEQLYCRSIICRNRRRSGAFQY